MIDVKRLGHATLATPDIERQVDYWTAVMGLRVVDRSKDRVLLATKLGQEALALEPGPDHFSRVWHFKSNRAAILVNLRRL